MTRLIVALFLIDTAVGWHAWLGQEAMTTVPGTSLEESLSLPAMSPAVDPCEIAFTSLRKIVGGRICLQYQEGCSLACATSWGSFLSKPL